MVPTKSKIVVVPTKQKTEVVQTKPKTAVVTTKSKEEDEPGQLKGGEPGKTWLFCRTVILLYLSFIQEHLRMLKMSLPTRKNSILLRRRMNLRNPLLTNCPRRTSVAADLSVWGSHTASVRQSPLFANRLAILQAENVSISRIWKWRSRIFSTASVNIY